MLGIQWQQQQEKSRVQVSKLPIPLSISEAEILARDCGKTVIRLCGLRELIQELPRLGKVKVVTCNQHAVHEKTGQLYSVKLLESQGWIQGEAVNLRLLLNHWHYSFAVTEEYDDGYRYSFQFFDRDGTPVHKVYLTADSQREVYQSLIARYRSVDQRSKQSVAPVPKLPECADGEIDVTLLRQAWRALQDIQDLPALLRNFGVGRLQGLRLVGFDLATPIVLPDLQAFLEMMRDAALPVKFYVGNRGGMQAHTGFVTNICSKGPWYTILDTHFTLHLHQGGMVSAWVIHKPRYDGMVTVLELYSGDGQNVLQLLSPYQPGHPEYEIWRRLLVALETAPPSACGVQLTV